MARHKKFALTPQRDDASPASQRRHRKEPAVTPPTISTLSLSSRTVPRTVSRGDALLAPQPQQTMPPSSSLRPLLFVASLGNPTTAYANTLHSAGHIVLQSLAKHLQYPPFPSRSRSNPPGAVSHPSSSLLRRRPTSDDGGAVLSPGEDVASRATFWMCPSLMNVSGPTVAKAWKAWPSSTTASTTDDDADGAQRRQLVVLHDELESALGVVKVTKAGASAKGHNGIKSVQMAVKGLGGGSAEFVRIGIGIGRPEGRERGEVSDWVLRKMNAREREVLGGEEVAIKVVAALSGIGAG